MRIDEDWQVSEVKPMTIGDLREAIAGLHESVRVVYDDGNQSWPIDQFCRPCRRDLDFTLFANGAPDGREGPDA